MFFETAKGDHNLPYNPFKACIVPRPIGWISSMNKSGVANLAPYSYFNAISDAPPTVMFSSANTLNGGLKDSITNIEETGEFVVNLATLALKEEMHKSSTSLPYGVSEFEHFNIKSSPAHLVKPLYVADAAVHLECKYLQTISLETTKIVLGHVIGISIKDEFIRDGKLDISLLQPIARLGYDEYAVIDKIFKMKRLH